MRALDVPRIEPRLHGEQQTRAILTEYLRVDDELNAVEVERRNYRLGAPLSLMIAGSAAGVVFGVLTALQGADVRDLEANLDSPNYVGSANEEDVVQARRAKRGFLAVSLIGASVGVGSAVWFVRRLLMRRPLERARLELRTQRDTLKLQLKLHLSDNGFAANVVAPF